MMLEVLSEQANMATSFFQYRYCELCKFSHKQRKKKHIYSKRHQLTLQAVLTKFGKKIEAAKQNLQKVVVQPAGWETDARVWCYMCVCEVDRHQPRTDCTVANAVFLTHLASADHSQKTHQFFWENMVSMDRKTNFIISMKEVNKFMVDAEQAVADFQKREKEKLLQEANKIRATEHRSQVVTYMGNWQQRVASSTARTGKASSTVTSSQTADAVGLVGKKTVFAYGPGLTCITRTEEDSSEGNVHSGATPPWLKTDDEEGSREIGPTAETFQKHLKALEKKKLPAGRVGATFDHKVDTGSQWLPAFGRVWNSGRRLNSQQQFMRERRNKDRTKRSSVHQDSKGSSHPPPQSPHPTQPTDTHRDFRPDCVRHETSQDWKSHGENGTVDLTRNSSSHMVTDTAHRGMLGNGWDSAGPSSLAAYTSTQSSDHNRQLHTHTGYQPVASTSEFSQQNSVGHSGVTLKRAWESLVQSNTSAVSVEDEDFEEPCGYQPYKRRRRTPVSHTVTSEMIPITVRLLSEPAGTKHHSQ